MPVSDSFPEHQHQNQHQNQLTRRRLLATGVGAAAVFGLPRFAATAATTASPENLTATNAALQSVDLSGSWSFTPAGQGTTSIMVPGGGWYKQGFTNVGEAVYSRSITVPDSGQPQSVWIEFGVVNHQATLSVDGRVVGTQTTSFTPSKFDITAYVTPGSTHTISVDVKGRNALKSSSGNYLVPVAADWCEAIPQGIFRSAFLRVYPAVYVSDAFVRTSVANQSLTYDVSVTNTSGSSRSVTLTGSLASDNGTSFSYPTLPSATVTVAAHSTAKVTVGPVAWNLGTTSYWWPNVPYRSGYRAQLHDLSVHASTDDGHTSDATYRFGFREFTQNGAY
jgi:beta-galactosidase/beta-glucuronidase